jgi:hypothetical protein
MTPKILVVLLFCAVLLKAEEPIPVALISNTKITVDELQKTTPKEFQLRFIKTKIEKKGQEDVYSLENNSAIEFATVKSFRFDLIPEVLKHIQTDIKTDVLFVLQNEIREIKTADGSEEIVVKLKLISVDLNAKNLIDFIEEGKVLSIVDQSKKEKILADAMLEISGKLMKKSNGVFLQKINRRLNRSNPYLPLGVLPFFGIEKKEFEDHQEDFKKLINESLKAPLNTIEFKYNSEEKAGMVKFNSLYESNDQIYLLRKAISESESNFFNAFDVQFSMIKLTPMLKKSLQAKIIVRSSDGQKCEKICGDIMQKLKKNKMDIEVYWLDDPRTQRIYKAEVNFLKPSDFSPYGYVIVKDQSIESIKKILETEIKDLSLTIKFANEKCLFLEAK